MLKINRKYLFAAVILLSFMFPTTSVAQESTAYGAYSPYSLFGFGLLEKEGNQNSLSMGGMGIGDRNNAVINLLNPAAITAREKKSFMLDFGINQSNVYYSADASTAVNPSSDGKSLTSVNNVFNIHHIAASFPIYKNSAFKVGIIQYSNTGYDFSARENDDNILANIGDISYDKQGQGGIYQVFLGGGITFFNRLSLGADLIYYFGTIDRYSDVTFNSNTTYMSLQTGNEYVARGFSGKFGLQYEQPLSDDITLTVGATYQMASKMKGDLNKYVYASTSSDVDTLSETKISVSGYEIPAKIGVGFTLKKKDKWMFGLDYTRQDWTKTEFEATPGSDFTTCLAQSVNAGFEYTPNKYDIRYYSKRITYRGGVYYNQTYMALNGNQINNVGLTFGISLPIYYRNTSVSLGIDVGQTGMRKDKLIRERYFKFTCGLNLFDIWFQKPLYN